MIELVHDPVFVQRSDAVFAEFLAEGVRVVAAISSEASQVAGVAPRDLRAYLRVVCLLVMEWMSVTDSVSTSKSG